MPSIINKKNISLDTLHEEANVKQENLILEQLDDGSNQTISESSAPQVLGEQAVSGDMTDVESDDDTLLNSHQVGLRINEDYENPQPLDMAKDIRKAEQHRRDT